MDVSPNAFESHRSADIPLPVGEPLIVAARADAPFEFTRRARDATPRSLRGRARARHRARTRKENYPNHSRADAD